MREPESRRRRATNVILEAFKAEDNLNRSPLLDDELTLDPLSAAPRGDDTDDDLSGLY